MLWCNHFIFIICCCCYYYYTLNTTIFGPALNILGDLFLIFVYYSFYAPYLLVILNIRLNILIHYFKKMSFSGLMTSRLEPWWVLTNTATNTMRTTDNFSVWVYILSLSVHTFTVLCLINVHFVTSRPSSMGDLHHWDERQEHSVGHWWQHGPCRMVIHLDVLAMVFLWI